jgi:hypothetical protein
MEIVLLVREKRHVNAFYSNDEIKERMGPRVKDFFEIEIEKRFRSIEVQAGNGKLTEKHKTAKTLKNKNQSTAGLDISDIENSL